jgi:hypothetical protein
MKYKEELLQYQKVFEGTLKRKYKSINDVKVGPESFEEIMEYSKDYPHKTLDVIVKWDVRVSIDNDEHFTNLSSLGGELFYIMFKIKGVVPWINLESDYGN